MAEVLFMVGRGQEHPSVIDQLLDVSVCQRKPHYGLASELPLLLFDCGFEDVQLQTDPGSHYCCVLFACFFALVVLFQMSWRSTQKGD